jgi:hypothetical protein
MIDNYKEYYNMFEKCMLLESTTASYCSKKMRDIIPSKNYSYNNIQNEFLTYKLHSSFVEHTYVNWVLEDVNIPTTNDDVKVWMKNLLYNLENEQYITEYKLSYSKTNEALVAVLKTKDQDSRSELYDFFDNFPESFNTRVLTYIS